MEKKENKSRGNGVITIEMWILGEKKVGEKERKEGEMWEE